MKTSSASKEDNNITNVYQNQNVSSFNKKGSTKENQKEDPENSPSEMKKSLPPRPQEEYQYQQQKQNVNNRNIDVYDKKKRNALLSRFSPEQPIPEISENYD